MFLALLLLYQWYTTNEKFVLPHNNDYNPYRQELFLSFALSVVHNKHTIVTYKHTIPLTISGKYNLFPLKPPVEVNSGVYIIFSQTFHRGELWHTHSLIEWSSIHDTHHKSHSLQ